MADRTSGPGDHNQRSLIVGLIESRPDIIAHITDLIAQTTALKLTIIKNTNFEEIHAIDVLLAGLDVEPDATLTIAQEILQGRPRCGLIVYSSTGTPELLRTAMAAGARQFLSSPFTLEAVQDAAADVYLLLHPQLPSKPIIDDEPKQVITFFSPKGGVGTTTLAVNTACALSRLGRKVGLIDANIYFGNQGHFLDLPCRKTLLNVITHHEGITVETLNDAMEEHAPTGVKALASPDKPEDGDIVQAAHLQAIVGVMREMFDYIVIDTSPTYSEIILALLDVADHIVVPTGPELPSIKNLKAFLRIAEIVGYWEDKITPILMRSNTVSPAHLYDIQHYLNRTLDWMVVSDGKLTTAAANQGRPFVLSNPKDAVSQDVIRLAYMLDGQSIEESTVEPSPDDWLWSALSHIDSATPSERMR